jgi:ABC-type multidrug transport system ATPase subunit
LILSATNIGKRFSAGWVLRDASLALDPGEVVLLAGKNGAGKTTLARILATLLEADTGEIRFDGRSLPDGRRDARRSIGFASHRPLLYLGLSPLENLTLFARLAGVSAPASRAGELLERLQMTPFAKKPMERFSRGMIQRVSVARAFLGTPRLLLLDEPYAGLDDEGTAGVNALIEQSKAGGAATLVISHDRERLGALRTRLCVVDQGRVEAA